MTPIHLLPLAERRAYFSAAQRRHRARRIAELIAAGVKPTEKNLRRPLHLTIQGVSP